MTSLLVKSVYLMIALVVISWVITEALSTNLNLTRKEHELELRRVAARLLETLASNEQCLAYREQGKLEGKGVNLSLHRVLDVNKLNEFSSHYAELQPACAREFEHGYRVKVSALPLEIQLSKVSKQPRGVFEKILKLIDGKRVIFVIDVSGSMQDADTPGCEGYGAIKNSRSCCVKMFLMHFADMLSEHSKVALITFGHYNTLVRMQLELSKLSEVRDKFKQIILNLKPEDGTPMCWGLDMAYEHAKERGADAIVLLTDGEENICCLYDTHYVLPPIIFYDCPWPKSPKTSQAVATEHKDLNIPVYAIGFSSTARMATLSQVASISGGISFQAKECEELISVVEKPTELGMRVQTVWEFGQVGFSQGESLKQVLNISIPVALRFNQTATLPGKMEIMVVDGELEKLIGAIELACFSEQNVRLRLFFSYPVSVETKRVCLHAVQPVCQPLACDLPIQPKHLDAGSYELSIRYSLAGLSIA